MALENIKKVFTNPKDPRKDRYKPENLARADVRPEFARTSIHTGVRVLFYKKGCHFCKQWKKVIPYINKRMDNRCKKIEMVDIKGHDPRVEYLQPEGAPTLYIDGLVIKGITVSEFGIGFLEEYLREEMVV